VCRLSNKETLQATDVILSDVCACTLLSPARAALTSSLSCLSVTASYQPISCCHITPCPLYAHAARLRSTRLQQQPSCCYLFAAEALLRVLQKRQKKTKCKAFCLPPTQLSGEYPLSYDILVTDVCSCHFAPYY